MNNQSIKNNTGFTLLETLIAIAILTVAVGAAFSVAQKSLSAAYISKNQTTGVFLASEGIELVREVRDSVSLYNNLHPTTQKDWLQPIKDACNTTQLLTLSCVFDITPDSSGLYYNSSGTFVDANGIKQSTNQAAQDFVANKGFLLRIVTAGAQGGGTINYYTSASTASSYPGSIFYRKMTISETVNGSKKEAVVTSSVAWLNGQSYSISETLSNWQ